MTTSYLENQINISEYLNESVHFHDYIIMPLKYIHKTNLEGQSIPADISPVLIIFYSGGIQFSESLG